MTRTLYAISDLHLGGAPDFQMCPVEARQRLACFVQRLTQEGEPGDVELIINGDFIDFLAEESSADEPVPRFVAFESDDELAAEKLVRVVRRTDDGAPENKRVFPAFRAFCARGHHLTLLLGNHDLELSTARVRAQLVAALTGGAPARLQFLYDGEAYRIGDALFEHGNRYDGWNLVFHDALRHYRAAVSRNEPASFVPPPGSRLVSEVMNPLKAELRFIDLLKPENEAVLPLLVALRPRLFDDLKRLYQLVVKAVEAKLLQPRVGQPPAWPQAISGVAQAPLSLDELAISGSESGSAFMLMRQLRRISKQAEHDPAAAVRDALLGFRHVYQTTFDLFAEADSYEEAARRLAGDRDRVIVFGHTHLAKIFHLNVSGGTYINTGTWCPVIRLPERFYAPSASEALEAEVRAEVREFIADLGQNRTQRWCTLQTTCARLQLDAQGHVTERALLRVRDDGSTEAFDGYPER